MKIMLVAEALSSESRGIGLVGLTAAQRLAALAMRLGERGHDARVAVPLAGLAEDDTAALRPWSTELAWPGGLGLAVFEGRLGTLPLYALGHDLPAGALARALPELLLALDWQPDVLHAHGAESGLLPLVIRESLRDHPFFAEMALVFTVRDASRQRLRPPEVLDRLAIDRQVLRMDGAEFDGQVNFLKAGLTAADAVLLPSVRYAQEVQAPTFGEGLEGVFQKLAREGRLWGLADGIDYRSFDPASDPAIAHPFNLVDRSGKARCKEALQRELGFEPDSVPLVALIGELSAVKGADLLKETMGILAHMGLQLAVLGQGTPEDVAPFRRAFAESRAIRGVIGWDAALARRLLAGADMLLMPERFEPDGFWQQVAMRYGTVPIVFETGGLADAVQEFTPRTGEGTGFRFSRYEGEAMLAALRHAQGVYAQPLAWSRLRVNVMARDWSWEAAAVRYEEAYEKAIAARPLRV
ncbi:Glycogen synthase [compost metagenome]